jgi:predicted Zn-dependent peptidase
MKRTNFLSSFSFRVILFGAFISLVQVRCPAALADDSSSALAEMASKVHFETLPNGIRVILYNRGIAPVFSGAVVVRVGGSDEVLGETGISHMFEHMAFKGTRVVGTKDFAKEQRLLARLEEIASDSDAAQHLSAEQQKEWDDIHKQLKAIWVSDDFSRRYEKSGAVGLNATTDKEFTKYFVDFPRSAFELWCKMEADRLIRPVMRQFYQERDVVLEERRMRFDDDPNGRLYELLLGVAYQIHPYRAPVIGYERDLRRLTATKLEEFRKRFYTPRNIVVSVVGRVDPVEDMKVISEYFGAIPTAPEVVRDIPSEPEPQGERRVSLRMAASPQVMIAYAKPNYPHPDDPAISVASEILAGSKVSPLYVELVKKRQLAAGIAHEEGPGVAFPNLLIFSATTKAPHTNDTLVSGFDGVLERFKRNGPTQEQVDIAKRSIGMAYLEHLRSSQSLALDLGTSELAYGSWKASVEWYDQMSKVTVEDVKRVTLKYLSNDRRTIGTVERESKGEK